MPKLCIFSWFTGRLLNILVIISLCFATNFGYYFYKLPVLAVTVELLYVAWDSVNCHVTFLVLSYASALFFYLSNTE